MDRPQGIGRNSGRTNEREGQRGERPTWRWALGRQVPRFRGDLNALEFGPWMMQHSRFGSLHCFKIDNGIWLLPAAILDIRPNDLPKLAAKSMCMLRHLYCTAVLWIVEDGHRPSSPILQIANSLSSAAVWKAEDIPTSQVTTEDRAFSIYYLGFSV